MNGNCDTVACRNASVGRKVQVQSFLFPQAVHNLEHLQYQHVLTEIVIGFKQKCRRNSKRI